MRSSCTYNFIDNVPKIEDLRRSGSRTPMFDQEPDSIHFQNPELANSFSTFLVHFSLERELGRIFFHIDSGFFDV